MDNRARAKGIFAQEGALGAKHPGRRLLAILIVLAAIAGVIWYAVILAHSSSGPGAGGPGGGFGGGRGRRPSTTVGVATASVADIPITLDGLGTVTPAATVTVTPQVSGVITEIFFKEGQTVRKGQPLAQIDPRPLRQALLQAQGVLMRDEAQLTNARLQLSRDQTLLAQDSIARQDVDTQAALVKQLEGTVTTDRAQVGTAQLNLGYAKVVAPVPGRIGLRAIDLGNYIQAGSATGIAVVTEVTPIDVEFTVPQDAVPQIEAQARQGKLAATAYDRTKTVVLDEGQFSTLDNQVDPTTGTVKAKARFANAKGTLFPSQFVNVRIALQTLRNVVVVPVTAVRTGPDGDFVWGLKPDKTVTKVMVQRGPGTPTQTSIVRGLNPGARVITEGGDRLTEGAKVQLPGDRTGPPPQCAADIKKFCNGKPGGEMFQCMRENRAKFSPQCTAALAAARGGGGSGGSGGGQAAGGNFGGAAGGGGFQAPPEMQAARDARDKACAADSKKLCPGLEGREASACLRENVAKTSKPCQDASAKVRALMSSMGFGGGSGGGAPGGGPAGGGASPGPAAPAAPTRGGAPAGGGSGSGGGFTPSPEMAAAREALQKACAADISKLCPGKEGREAFMCLRENDDKLSGGCKAAREKMRALRPPSSGGGGGPGQ